MNQHEHQAELLDSYLAALCVDEAATPPHGLDEHMGEVAATLTRALLPPEPEPAFAQRLRARLDAEAARPVPAPAHREERPVYRNGAIPASPASRPEAFTRPLSMKQPERERRPVVARPRWLPVSRLATAAAVLLALVGIFAWRGRPRPVDALEIVQRAQAVDRSPGSAVTSFEMTTRITSRPGFGGFLFADGGKDVVFFKRPDAVSGTEPVQSELRQWFVAPGRMRVETVSVSEAGRQEAVLVSNGKETWSYGSGENAAFHGSVSAAFPFEKPAGVVRFVAAPAAGLLPGLSPDGEPGCPVPKLNEGTPQVAGRAAYMITVEMNGPKCPGIMSPPGIDRVELWVDRETFFILKTVDYGADGQPVVSTEVTSVRFNAPIDPERFTFTPPSGVPIREGLESGILPGLSGERRSAPAPGGGGGGAPGRIAITATATGPPSDPPH